MNAPPRRILVVDDDRTFRLSTATLLAQDGHAVETAVDAADAVRILDAQAFDLVLIDMRMPGLDGVTAVELLRKRGVHCPILMISGYGTIDTAVESLHRGADHFLSKPVDPDVLSAKVADLLEDRPGSDAVRQGSLGGMVGHAPIMQAVFASVRQVADSEATVLITGETGTGKELLARAVHDLSPRRMGPFVPVNCAALAEGVLESELFGHVRGAFTGAVASRQGLFAAAQGGTIFLDEVGDMSLSLQQRLLRVLQEKEVTPVGAVRPQTVDVRIVAATHRDLRQEMELGRFREDLYYRLNVFQVHLPPLRQRPSDVPLLVEAALARLRSREDADRAYAFSPLALKMMRGYAWPGNVRELFAVVESSVIRSGGMRVQAQHLPAAIREAAPSPIPDAEPTRYRTDGPDAERATIVAALEDADGSRVRAAEILGMSRTTLWRRMKHFGLDGGESEPED
ncbi:MAG: sigma-54 dependent transcriptional regulator [Gemmatimonadota bacterium]|nr:sigma-54 dependent transcriptional regulator [Gemmatimonadota bacterium]MDH5761196.1 sigma-54 dependent transcriptional regulator [Gemmatimonadota bacterium]